MPLGNDKERRRRRKRGAKVRNILDVISRSAGFISPRNVRKESCFICAASHVTGFALSFQIGENVDNTGEKMRFVRPKIHAVID